VGEPLTRSRIEAFDQTAQVLSDLASLLRAGGKRLSQAAAVYVQQINTPNGTEWKGQTALAAFDAASTDQQAANRAVAHANDMAEVSEGGDYLRGARAQTLEAIAQAENEAFIVAEDLSVTDTYSSDSSVVRAARQQAAGVHRNYIAHCVARLEAENGRVAAQLNAGAAEMVGMAPTHWQQPITGFGQPAPHEPGSNITQRRQGAIRAVDNTTTPTTTGPTPKPEPPNCDLDETAKLHREVDDLGRRYDDFERRVAAHNRKPTVYDMNDPVQRHAFADYEREEKALLRE
jgi:hypothetical protein